MSMLTSTSSSDVHGAALNITEMRRRLADDDELIAEIVAEFLDDYPARQTDIRCGLAARDPRRVRAAAHALKGAAANLAGASAVAAAGRLEQCCDPVDWTAAVGAADALEAELLRLAEALRASVARSQA